MIAAIAYPMRPSVDRPSSGSIGDLDIMAVGDGCVVGAPEDSRGYGDGCDGGRAEVGVGAGDVAGWL